MTQTGVTIMQMDAGLDTGPMLLERATPIAPRETAASLARSPRRRWAREALLEALDAIAAGTATPRAQPAEGVTYAAKIRKEEALIDWSRAAVEIDRQVRAFNPWPVAETRWNGQQLRVWEADADRCGNAGAAPGTVLATSAAGIDVATGDGVLRLTRVQTRGAQGDVRR